MVESFELKSWQLILYVIVFIVGITGNLLICLVVMCSPKTFRLVPFNVYILALAIVDLILATSCLPVYVMSTAVFPHPAGNGGTAMCKTITGYLLPFWLGGVSIYLLVVISFERYKAVRKPLYYYSRQTSSKTYLFILAAWVMGFIIQLPYIIGIVSVDSNATVGNHCSYTWKNLTTITFVFIYTISLLYVVPALIFILNVYRTKVCMDRFDRELQASFDNEVQRLKVIKRKRKTARVMLVVTLSFFVCWTPDNIMFLIFQYGGSKELSYNSDIFQLGMMLGFLNSCLNPFLYGFQSKEFRSHCKKVLKKLANGFRSQL